MQNATSPGCQVLNVFEPAKYGAVCEGALTHLVMQNGPRCVCSTHASAHDAGRELTFSDDAPVTAEAANG